jgi:amino acid permease
LLKDPPADPIIIDERGIASPFSCFLNLANIALGVGILSLPAAFARVGWLGGIILVSLTCVFSTFGLQLLLVSAKLAKAKGYTGKGVPLSPISSFALP